MPKHGDRDLPVVIPKEDYEADPALWAGLYTPMSEYLLLEEAGLDEEGGEK